MTTRIALVVSGGGAKGAYAAGAIKYLVTQGCTRFDLYAGTSTGALITTLALAGGYREMELRYTTGGIADYMQPLDLEGVRKYRGLVDSRPFRKTLEEVFTAQVAAQVFAVPAPQLILTAVQLRTGRLVYFHTGNPPADARWTQPWETWQAFGRSNTAGESREQLLQVLQASGSEPVKLPAVKLWLDADWYVDGGIRAYVPIKAALAAGATELFVVMHSAVNPDLTTPKAKVENFAGVVGQTLEIVLANTLAMDLSQARALADGTEIENRIVAPLQPITGVGGGPNTFGRQIFDRGFDDAKRVWGPLLDQRPDLKDHLTGGQPRRAGGPAPIARGGPRRATMTEEPAAPARKSAPRRNVAEAEAPDTELIGFWRPARRTRARKKTAKKKTAKRSGAKAAASKRRSGR